MRSTSFLIASRSQPERGRDKKSNILRSRSRNASRNARSICSGLPTTAAGSATPQGAVMGWPGHTGQTSFVAASHTVSTKSICGAPGFAFIPTLAAKVLRWHARQLNLANGFGPHSSGWMATRAIRMKERATFPVENCLRHDRSRGISRAQKNNVIDLVHQRTLPPAE